MSLCLNRPTAWWRGGGLHVLLPNHTHKLSAYDAALLLSQSRAGLALPPIAGDLMNDDFSTALTLITAPSTEPISLAQAKAFLRIEHTADDAAITLGITAARQHAEQYLRTALLPQVWEYKIANPCFATVNLPFGPAQNIVSVNLTTLGGATTPLNASTYRLSVDGRKVIFDPFPNADILAIRFTASLVSNAADVPPMLVQGMLHHLAVMMETRDGNAPLPVQAINLYQPYRRISL